MTEAHHERQPDDHGSHRGVPTGTAMDIVYVCALAAAVAGLYFGFHYNMTVAEAPYPQQRVEARAQVPHGAVPATAYADIRSGNLGPNAGLRTTLRPPKAPADSQEPVVPGDAATKLADLAARAERRAYNGAPPTIPHRVDPRDATTCVACHGPEGLRLGDVTARPMPHAHLANCTQCHVARQPVAAEEQRWLDNDFAGLPAPTAGHRAYPGAPPVIPHAVHMRENCATCHGWSGTPGLKSSHPWRKSCTQCHAPWAFRDMHPGAGADSPLFLPGPDVRSGEDAR
ncbi:MAG: diheme cytochrome c precursor [Planctomycetes bacterium]|nr:diheme cytochrome c precursor [Planctomycetota bacterium]